MTFALVALLVLAVVERVWREREHARERRRLTNAVMAKNGGEFLALERERPARERSPERDRAEQLVNPIGY